jgi:prepilin-type N-terminal cleavage/methylation domain-containing protein
MARGLRLTSPSMRTDPTYRSEQGFTLIELMMGVMLIGILGAMAVFQIAAVRPGVAADGATRALVAQLNFAREHAVSRRRLVRLEWDLANTLLRVVELPIAPAIETVTLSEITFEGGVRFGVLGGAGDTPDGFGMAAAADFDNTPVQFTTDGSLVDNAGTPINGSFFLLIPNVGNTFRAVTILGSIGRVRGYRWNGTQWTRI